VRQNGGNDAEIMTATRGVFAGVQATLLKTADDATRLAHLELMIAELTAASAVSADACTQLSAGTLDITKSLPPEVVAQDLKWLEKALASPSRPDPQPADSVEVGKVMEAVIGNMTQDAIAVVASPELYADQPKRVCESSISFYRAIHDLPQVERSVALSAIYQGDE
jgi:hypothetical protein